MCPSSEIGEPNAYEGDFDLDDVAAGRYGGRLHFWNLAEGRVEQTLELGATGLVPLEVRWLHDPDVDQGFVGYASCGGCWRRACRHGRAGRRCARSVWSGIGQRESL
jgi:selenium-binding protein 1